MNWKALKTELQTKFGKDELRYFNDKRKYTRRIKIYGKNKYVVREYLNTKYPHLTVWETMEGCYNGYFSGICFNLPH